jgi:hypothetical protein
MSINREFTNVRRRPLDVGIIGVHANKPVNLGNVLESRVLGDHPAVRGSIIPEEPILHTPEGESVKNVSPSESASTFFISIFIACVRLQRLVADLVSQRINDVHGGSRTFQFWSLASLAFFFPQLLLKDPA